MTWDPNLTDLMPEEVTIEPFVSETAARAQTFGAAVTYTAQIVGGAKRVIGASGREVISTVQVKIQEQLHIDQRSRVTLPTGWVPNQPPIVAIRPLKTPPGSIGMDHTEIDLA